VEAGSVIGGKYRLRREIGQGSMGTVWAAVHDVLDRQVAIKFLTQSFEDPSTAAARFMAEARAAAQVKHRAVVDVFDFGITEQGVSYMVQELLDGQPLSQVMCDGPAWPVRDAARFMMECLLGLAAVHERGIVHRDLKPENIFVLHDSEGRVPKLLDFGISKSAEPQKPDRRVPRPSLRRQGVGRLTAVGAALGTPAYMSPEQLRNLSTLDARADVYSLGCVFYEWLAGHCPFASTHNFAELLDRIEAREMEPLELVRPDLGPQLCALIARALEPDRERRYSSAVEMRAAIARAFEQLPPVRTRVQNPATTPLAKTLPPPSFTYLPATHTIEVKHESLRPGQKPPSVRPPSVRPPSERPVSVRPEMLRAPSLPSELSGRPNVRTHGYEAQPRAREHGAEIARVRPETVRPKVYIPEAESSSLALSRPSSSAMQVRARSVTEALDSLQPPPPVKAGLSRRFWLAAAGVGLVLAVAPLAWRARSRATHAVTTLHTTLHTTPAHAAEPLVPAPPSEGGLPSGVLPPEAAPAHEEMPVDPPAAPLREAERAPTPAATERAHKPRHPAHEVAEPHTTRKPARADEAAEQPAPASAAERPAAPAATPPSNGKLLRSLDF
jgi:serine/threonine protein kinase